MRSLIGRERYRPRSICGCFNTQKASQMDFMRRGHLQSHRKAVEGLPRLQSMEYQSSLEIL